MTAATSCRTLSLMPSSTWMAFGDANLLASQEPAFLDHDDPFGFELETVAFSDPSTSFAPSASSVVAAFTHPLTAPSSSSSSPALPHHSGPDPIHSLIGGGGGGGAPSLFHAHRSIPGFANSAVLSPGFSPPRSPIMPPVEGFLTERAATSGSPHNHPLNSSTTAALTPSQSVSLSPLPSSLPSSVLESGSRTFFYDDPPGSLASASWFDSSLSAFDSHLPGPSASATFSSISPFVSLPGSGQSALPLTVTAPVSNPVQELNAFTSLPPVPTSYSMSVAPAISSGPDALDFGAIATSMAPAMSSAPLVNPLATLSSSAGSIPYMMAPLPPPPQSAPPGPAMSLDGLMPVMTSLSHSPDISPLLDSKPSLDFSRPSKRQKVSKSGPISPNLLAESQTMSRTTPKSTRQDSAEAEDRKGQCPIPECGRVFKDLKAHMLTHQTERPEKCPITTCEYHFKGFARKYDKNRHTLTHYRGTMVCIFCPGFGSAAEQTFNRVDAFKKHLTVSHGVEQAPPNSRKRNSSGRPIVHANQNNSSNSNAGSTKGGETAPNSAVTSVTSALTDGSAVSRSDALCSTCSLEFHSPQEFYEHLDDCVLRVVQKLDPAEMYNERNLGVVAEDDAVIQTLAKHNLPADGESNNANGGISLLDDDQDDNSSDLGRDSDALLLTRNHNPTAGGGLSMGKQLHPTGSGANQGGSSRRRRRNYPTSWGCPPERMNIRKRVMCVYDGPKRLCKDNMVLDREYEVRVKLADGKSYVTDLDVQMLNRADELFIGKDDVASSGPAPPVPGSSSAAAGLDAEFDGGAGAGVAPFGIGNDPTLFLG